MKYGETSPLFSLADCACLLLLSRLPTPLLWIRGEEDLRSNGPLMSTGS
jgi:hypothetical protein